MPPKIDQKHILITALVVISLLVIIITLDYTFGMRYWILSKSLKNFDYPEDVKNLDKIVTEIDDIIEKKYSKLNTYNSQTKVVSHEEISQALLQMQNERHVERGYNLSQHLINNLLELDFVHDVNPTCKQYWNETDNSTLKLVIIIKNAVNNFKKRDAIRKTWFADFLQDQISFRTVFSLGSCHEENPVPNYLVESNNGQWTVDDCRRAVENETLQFKDIIQTNAIDTYNNLTIKALMNFKWLNERCDADMALIVDDDQLINIQNVVALIHRLSKAQSINKIVDDSSFDIMDIKDKLENEYDEKVPIDPKKLVNETIYFGHVYKNSYPKRSPYNKYYLSYIDYPYDQFPPFVHAAFTLVSRRSIRLMYLGSYFTKTIIRDDPYMGIVAYKLGIKPLHSRFVRCTEEILGKMNVLAHESCLALDETLPNRMLEIWKNHIP